MSVKSYLSRLVGNRHTTGAPTVLDCEGLDVINQGDATADTLTVTTINGSVPITAGTTGDVTFAAGVSAIGSGKVLTGMMSDLLLHYTNVTVSSAELLAINATPKTIVAAPGAGYIVLVHRVLLVLNYNSAAYANNGILGLYETNATGAVLTGTLTLASFLGATADTVKELHPLAHSATTGLTRLDNKAVVLTQATGESISGNSPVNVHCWYSIIPHGL